MTKQEIFKAAHAITRATLQAGDSYAVTFAAALRMVYADKSKSKSALTEVERKILDIAQAMMAEAAAELDLAETEYQDLPDEIQVCRDYAEDCAKLVAFVEAGNIPADKADFIYRNLVNQNLDWRRLAAGYSTY